MRQTGRQRGGLRQVFAFDKSRTWLPTRDVEGKFSPDASGPADVVAWVEAGKADGIKPRFELSCGKRPLSECIDQEAFNNGGSALLKQKRADIAVVLFELVAWSHPQSANAQDSLADGYLAAGKKEQAIEASKRVLALAPGDASVDESTRAQLIAAAKQRMSSIAGN